MTLVLDLGWLVGWLVGWLDFVGEGAVVNVSSGRGAAALRLFFKRLKQSGAKIKAVATDMAGGSIKAVQECLPDATPVFDRFHIVKLMNEKPFATTDRVTANIPQVRQNAGQSF